MNNRNYRYPEDKQVIPNSYLYFAIAKSLHGIKKGVLMKIYIVYCGKIKLRTRLSCWTRNSSKLSYSF